MARQIICTIIMGAAVLGSIGLYLFEFMRAYSTLKKIVDGEGYQGSTPVREFARLFCISLVFMAAATAAFFLDGVDNNVERYQVNGFVIGISAAFYSWPPLSVLIAMNVRLFCGFEGFRQLGAPKRILTVLSGIPVSLVFGATCALVAYTFSVIFNLGTF